MIDIPDTSIKTAFGTNEYTDVSLLRTFKTGINLGEMAESGEVSAEISPISWSYSGEAGISQSTGEAITATVASEGQGCYSVTLPAQTTPTGLVLTWFLNNSPIWRQYFMARYFMPLWSSLKPGVQATLKAILSALQLLHDNSYGNSTPNLAENLQVHYSMETIAEAAQTALTVFQTQIIQPTGYSLNTFPAQFYGLLYTATLRELVHRFYLGYLEVPEIHGDVGVAYADYRSYFDRWKGEYDKLGEIFVQQLSIYEREQLDLTGASILLGGGYFGNGGAFIKNQQLQAMQNSILQQQYFAVTMSYNPGPINGGE